MMRATRLAKLNRMADGSSPRVLELCSGCGGMSLGLQAAGFSLLAHVENDPVAAASYAINFSPPVGVEKDRWAAPRDMIECSASDLAEDLGLAEVSGEFDVLAAGLPCQAFARIGRSKLRSVTGDEDAFRNDPRARLYRRFLEYVEAVQPVVIIIENVPDILNFGGHNIPEEICQTLDELGYHTSYTLLNAAFYGVPQMRERLFLIAYDRSIGQRPTFPDPTHAAELPSGYEGARTVALKYIPAENSHFHPIPIPAADLPGAVATKAALSDLPYISEHYRDPGEMRRRKLTDKLPYRSFSGLSAYAKRMRAWKGFETGGETDGHLVRLTPRDFAIFRRMRAGADYPRALQIAETIFAERLAQESPRPRKGSKRWIELRNSCVPPYDPDKFPNKWWKLEPTFPSRTLTAHLGKDSYSHIHWDSRQQRVISVREAARLQSFPDGFRFAGAMNAGFRQIGNAVPPLLALSIGCHMLSQLGSALGRLTDDIEGAEAA
ncbi:DNA cytosine methyltransferase [Mesorhizobium sp. AR02]|uniref:DNA cytosine methyltransferase n=1 Tax=Mesorhizobium sp. AR02 TaxID=2865837 RepID=UPI00215EABBF|nr:DNA cytosine methyltransferase [Mesorhizobium sp. AR02]UVK55375.1 DNA cytosine methyltransferase [Mesorhizobium sp. AR02]